MIANAPILTVDNYNKIRANINRTEEEQCSYAKMRLKICYRVGDDTIDASFIQLYRPFMPKFYNLIKILPLYEEGYKEYPADDNLGETSEQRAYKAKVKVIQDMLYDLTGKVELPEEFTIVTMLSKYYPRHKKAHQFYHCLQFLWHLGFMTPLDDRTIDIDKSRLTEYFKTYRDTFINPIFDTTSNATDDSRILTYVNRELHNMFGIRVVRDTTGSKGNTKYVIKCDINLIPMKSRGKTLLVPKDVVIVDPLPGLDPVFPIWTSYTRSTFDLLVNDIEATIPENEDIIEGHENPDTNM